jgi:hypothetical protein
MLIKNRFSIMQDRALAAISLSETVLRAGKLQFCHRIYRP